MPVLLPFRASRFSVPAGELPGLTYVPGEEPPGAFGGAPVVRDSEPALFVYRQRFRFPGEAEESERIGVMGLLNRDEARIFEHEQISPDRAAACAAALEASATDPGSLWLWCGDEDGLLGLALSGGEDDGAETTDRFGCTHRISRIAGPVRIESVQRALAGRPLFLADGHHRYAAGWNLATIQIRTGALRTRPGSGPSYGVDDIERDARAGILLPPKSTDFYPKLIAGLVMHRHRDKDGAR